MNSLFIPSFCLIHHGEAWLPQKKTDRNDAWALKIYSVMCKCRLFWTQYSFFSKQILKTDCPHLQWHSSILELKTPILRNCPHPPILSPATNDLSESNLPSKQDILPPIILASHNQPQIGKEGLGNLVVFYISIFQILYFIYSYFKCYIVCFVL